MAIIEADVRPDTALDWMARPFGVVAAMLANGPPSVWRLLNRRMDRFFEVTSPHRIM